jgi:diguanylate cyclase (GGDEF)-like protein/PAS domain S-box-containing protein
MLIVILFNFMLPNTMVYKIQFLSTVPDASILYATRYSVGWIVVSVLLSIFASYAALSASNRIQGHDGKSSNLIWLFISALALGAGTWAMNFVGMLALRLPCAISYDPVITVISMFPSFLAGSVVFGLVGRNEVKQQPLIVGSILLGGGMGSMHYTGMTAMRFEGIIRYDPALFALSIIVAIVLSYFALFIKNNHALFKKYGDIRIAVILGGAFSGMHYTAMSATYFVKGSAEDLSSSAFTPDSLAIIVALTTTFLAFVALALASLSRAREVTETLRLSEKRFQSTIESIPDAICLKDAKSRWLVTNEAAKRLYHLHEIPWQGKTEDELAKLNPEFYSAHQTSLLGDAATWEAGEMMVFSEFSTTKDNQRLDLEVRKVPVYDAQGHRQALVTIGRDVTVKNQTEADLRIAAIAFESQESMMVSDANRMILRVNQSFANMTGYTAEDVVGKPVDIFRAGSHDESFYDVMWESVNKEGAWQGEIQNKRKNGDVYSGHVSINAVKNQEGIITNYVSTLTDVTSRKAAEEKIQNLAFYEPLTQLPNRRLFVDRLTQAIAYSARSGNHGALLFLDLDYFKTLNDTLGHAFGDLLLQQVAERLKSCVREYDTVARFGGDEFVVLLEDLSDHPIEAAMQTESVVEKILAALNQNYLLGIYDHHSTPSIGATLFNSHDQDIDELLKQADIAMYQAKKNGRNNLKFFNPHMQDTINNHAYIESELRKALDKQQLHLYYQIQVDSSGKPLGAEALIRWIHPERGLISPFQFIPMAEETGLILPIGKWVLDTACSQLKTWQQDPAASDLVLAVNVSAKQFIQTDFVEQVKTIVQLHGINPTRLKLELTESMLLDNIEHIISTMITLKEFGIKFSLDDFGTGYSSLQYLKKLPLNQLKIDQSFVRDIATDHSDRAIVGTIIAMAQNLDISVIAEGVETVEQQQLLLGIGCTHYQGYLYSKPVPIAEFEALLK